MVVQEYPACAENPTVIGSDVLEVVEDVGCGADDMLSPAQALHTRNPASARMVPPTEIFTGLPPQPSGCKEDAIVKSKHSSQLASWTGTWFSTVEDVCHYFSRRRMLRARRFLKSSTTGPIVMFDHLKACRLKRVVSPSTTPAAQPVRELNVLALGISVSPRNRRGSRDQEQPSHGPGASSCRPNSARCSRLCREKPCQQKEPFRFPSTVPAPANNKINPQRVRLDPLRLWEAPCLVADSA
jgi:hypothetical protein